MSYDIDHPDFAAIEAKLRAAGMGAEADALFAEIKTLRGIVDDNPEMCLALICIAQELRDTRAGDPAGARGEWTDDHAATVTCLALATDAFRAAPRLEALNQEFARLRAIETAARDYVKAVDSAVGHLNQPLEREPLDAALAVWRAAVDPRDVKPEAG